MNNINDKDIDKMLDEVKNTPIPEEEFKSTEEFEKEFFKRVAKEGVAEKKKIRPALKIIFTAVAAMAVCCCILPAFIDKSDDSHNGASRLTAPPRVNPMSSPKTPRIR